MNSLLSSSNDVATDREVIVRAIWNNENVPGNTNQLRWYGKSTAGTSSDPYTNMSYTSNFTIAVFDSVDGSAITTTPITINISNGIWSREDTLSGTNTITYPFDEGVYNISIIVEGNTQTHSNYDLSTQSNYLKEDFTFYFNMTNCSAGSSNIALNFTIKSKMALLINLKRIEENT